MLRVDLTCFTSNNRKVWASIPLGKRADPSLGVNLDKLPVDRTLGVRVRVRSWMELQNVHSLLESREMLQACIDLAVRKELNFEFKKMVFSDRFHSRFKLHPQREQVI